MKKLTLILAVIATVSSYSQTGINWGPILDVDSPSEGNSRPRMVIDGSGAPVVLWGNGYTVYIATWNGTAFNTPQAVNSVNAATASWQGPDIASYGDTIYVVYKETPEASATSQCWLRRSFDGGVTFDPAVQVTNIADSVSRFPTVTTDDLGNPIVAFMKFDPSFGDARWVVVTSSDYGATFSTDVKASGWSSPTSEVCDCCPGGIVSSGNDVVMMYRDNNSDIRDSWIGVSNDGGTSFTSGINVDQQNWNINYCPSSGPDGVIVGDTVYMTFMNGNIGSPYVFYSRASISTMNSNGGTLVSQDLTGINTQNFPRIDNYNSAVAYGWRQQTSTGNALWLVTFAQDITSPFPTVFDTVAVDDAENGDVAMSANNVYAVWQDGNTGNVKFRSGTYSSPGSEIYEIEKEQTISIYPNPASEKIVVQTSELNQTLTITDELGKIVYTIAIETNETIIDLSAFSSGIYFLNYNDDVQKFVVE